MKYLFTRSIGVLGLFAVPAIAQGFGPATNHAFAGVRQVRAGDVNSDGLNDLLILGSGAASFGLYLGTPGGGLTAATAPTAAFNPAGAVLCDLDADGDLDIAALDPGSPMLLFGRLVKLLGDGAGGFGGATNVGTGFNAQALAAGDVNADAQVDLVVAAITPSSVYVFRGLGGGAFQAPLTQPDYFAPDTISLADMDGNGTRDAVACNGGTHNVSVFLNPGSGALSPMVNYASNSDTRSAEVADVNGDGVPDVVASASSVNPGITFFPGLGGGVLGTAVLNPGGSYPLGFALVDADANGKHDALVSDYFDDSMRVFTGNGAGGFAVTQTVNTADGPFDIETADLNHDGHVDAICTNISAATFSVMLQIPPAVVGAASYGTGSGGCFGQLGLGVNMEPRVNTPDFTYTITHAPRNSLGVLIATDVKDVAGSDLFGIGILLHCDLLAATEIYALDIVTELAGVGRAASPLPNNPLLIGLQYAACAVHLENPGDGLDCGASPFKLVSSRGIEITIQP